MFTRTLLIKNSVHKPFMRSYDALMEANVLWKIFAIVKSYYNWCITLLYRPTAIIK